FVEQQLDLNIKPYESFPDPQIFKRERCSQYRARISVDWEPLSSDYRSVQTGVARALRILKEICSSLAQVHLVPGSSSHRLGKVMGTPWG
ncbi:MAG: hypothetical protein ACK5V3_13900, partial [Bdellovibrionales bacterium]